MVTSPLLRFAEGDFIGSKTEVQANRHAAPKTLFSSPCQFRRQPTGNVQVSAHLNAPSFHRFRRAFTFKWACAMTWRNTSYSTVDFPPKHSYHGSSVIGQTI